jgi:hypothetical protein
MGKQRHAMVCGRPSHYVEQIGREQGQCVSASNFIILNLAVGGAAQRMATVFPQRMYIDYVRVYQ